MANSGYQGREENYFDLDNYRVLKKDHVKCSSVLKHETKVTNVHWNSTRFLTIYAIFRNDSWVYDTEEKIDTYIWLTKPILPI
jgi:hypothetical protein